MRLILLFLFTSIFVDAQNNLLTPFEKGNKNQSTTYEECIEFYQELDKKYASILMIEQGLTDSGKPLHLVFYSSDNVFLNTTKKTVLLINNGIHPGEPDGIDATMMLMRDLASGKIKTPKNTLIAAIPVYNIGGMLNRNSSSRANQNGPEEYGFRGNGRNYDLNRDFIKSDTKNSRSFQKLFTELNPDIFLDNHVSNGADYQYTFTCIATQHEKLGSTLGNYFKNELYPSIVKDMNKKKIDVVPYVNVHSTTPDKGFEQFTDTPRYATGYTTLFHTLGFVPETHMLKAYKDRVHVTYEFMVSTINFADANWEKIKQMRNVAIEEFTPGKQYPLQWALDSTKVSYIDFKGYEGGYKPSDISGKNRLYYDRSKPFTKKIPFYGNYKPTQFVTIPKAYIIPQSQWQVLDILKLNGIAYTQLQKDTIIEIESYKIESYQTSKSPYEGHYGHYNTKISKSIQKVKFFKGDYVYNTNQTSVKYLVETLEPEAVDSFFNWNFFDTILQQKEGYSAYVFEDMATQILAENPTLKQEFEAKKQSDKAFAENGGDQLYWVYKHSKYFEKAFMQYPVYRVN
ncbi:M14 family metallopeptidase [Flavobacterium urocaniciphilum]|uniref:Zinc carboxypeptidase n=1 Tax=Flavobacterium urocaniciphilum TaxID=1299341 RepID=A0A1H8ZGR4_9FLAO|nr:M14 family metallopeptidase [Flavobacterium urocaniciphilum]SEP63533.1 hypothetical protein SAMN05444005_101700 [Flavobacterium urocaniciphilum]